MHKVILRASFGTAFSTLETAMGLLNAAFSASAGTGENALNAIQAQIATLRNTINEAIESL